MMLKDHKKVVDMFKKEGNDAKDPDLKTWVMSTLPTLQMHLDSIKAISGKQ
jgi:putative membrane protein